MSLVAACAGPLSSSVCVKEDWQAFAARVASEVEKSGGSYAVIVVNHSEKKSDTLDDLLKRELNARGFTLRDEAESERFLRVSLEKSRIYVEVLDRVTRRALYLHEYALDRC